MIETLLERGYISRSNKTQLLSTSQGQFLIEQLKQRKLEFLIQPEITSIWESELEKMEKGAPTALSRETFLQTIKQRTQDLLMALDSAKTLKLEVLCPKTRLPVKKTEKGYIFPGFPNVLCPFQILHRTMEPREYRDILASKEGAGPFEGFVSRTKGTQFMARLVFNPKTRRFDFKFESRKPQS